MGWSLSDQPQSHLKAALPLVGIMSHSEQFIVLFNLCCDLHKPLVFRTFWSIFLVTALASIPTGAFVVICACPLSNRYLFKVGGAFQLCGGKNNFSSIP